MAQVGGTNVRIDLTGAVSDPDPNDVLSIIVTAPASGYGTVTRLGLIVTYTPPGVYPAGEHGQQAKFAISYTVFDGRGGTATSTINITLGK